MERFVQISSTITITVTGPILYLDRTNTQSLATERLNIQEMSSGLKCQILQGNGYYPSCILEWGTVKALQKAGKFVIGAMTNECSDEKAIAEAERLEREYSRLRAAGLKIGKEDKEEVVEKKPRARREQVVTNTETEEKLV